MPIWKITFMQGQNEVEFDDSLLWTGTEECERKLAHRTSLT